MGLLKWLRKKSKAKKVNRGGKHDHSSSKASAVRKSKAKSTKKNKPSSSGANRDNSKTVTKAYVNKAKGGSNKSNNAPRKSWGAYMQNAKSDQMKAKGATQSDIDNAKKARDEAKARRDAYRKKVAERKKNSTSQSDFVRSSAQGISAKDYKSAQQAGNSLIRNTTGAIKNYGGTARSTLNDIKKNTDGSIYNRGMQSGGTKNDYKTQKKKSDNITKSITEPIKKFIEMDTRPKQKTFKGDATDIDKTKATLKEVTEASKYYSTAQNSKEVKQAKKNIAKNTYNNALSELKKQGMSDAEAKAYLSSEKGKAERRKANRASEKHIDNYIAEGARKAGKDARKKSIKEQELKEAKGTSRAEAMGATKVERQRAEKQGAIADTAYHVSHPFLAGMTDNATPFGGVIDGGGYSAYYTDDMREQLAKSKSTKAYGLGSFAGQAVQFAAPSGVGGKIATRVLPKATTGARAVANIGARSAIETGANTPFNAMQSYKETLDANGGDFNAKDFAKALSKNSALDLAFGGIFNGAGSYLLSKYEGKKLVNILAKQEKNGVLDEADTKELNRIVEKLNNKEAGTVGDYVGYKTIENNKELSDAGIRNFGETVNNARQGRILREEEGRELIRLQTKANAGKATSEDLDRLSQLKGKMADSQKNISYIQNREKTKAENARVRAEEETRLANEQEQAQLDITEDYNALNKMSQSNASRSDVKKAEAIVEKKARGEGLTPAETQIYAETIGKVRARNDGLRSDISDLKEQLKTATGKKARNIKKKIERLEKNIDNESEVPKVKVSDRKVYEMTDVEISNESARLGREVEANVKKSESQQSIPQSNKYLGEANELRREKAVYDDEISRRNGTSAPQAESNSVKESPNEGVKASDDELAQARKDARVKNTDVNAMSDEEINAEIGKLSNNIKHSFENSGNKMSDRNIVRQARVEELQAELKARGVDVPEDNTKAKAPREGDIPEPDDALYKDFKSLKNTDSKLNVKIKSAYRDGIDISDDLRGFIDNQKKWEDESLPDTVRDEAHEKAREYASRIYNARNVNSGNSTAPSKTDAVTSNQLGTTGEKTKGKLKEDLRREWEDSLIGFESVAKANNDTNMLNQVNDFRNVEKRVAGWINTSRVGVDRKLGGKPLSKIIDKRLIKNDVRKKEFGEYLEAKLNGSTKDVVRLEAKYKDEIKNFYNDIQEYISDINKFSKDSGISDGTNKLTIKDFSNDVDELYEELVKTTRDTISNGELNRLVENYAKNTGLDVEAIKNSTKEEIEEMSFVPSDRKNDYSLTYYANGKKMTIKADRQTVLGLKEWSGADREDWVKALYNSKLQKTARIFKGLITDWNVVFGVRNGARDFQQALVNSKDTRWYSKSLPDSARMIADEDNPMRKLYDSFGGKYSTLFELDKLSKINVDEPNGFGKVMDKIEGFNTAIESVPRMSEFAGTIKKAADKNINGGLSKLKKDLEKEYADKLKLSRDSAEYKKAKKEMEHKYYQSILDAVDGDVISEAMRNSNDITLNFGRSGYKTKALNSGAVPFFNPSIQGLSKTARLFSEGKSSGQLLTILAKLGGFTVAPSLANEFFCRGNDSYQKIPDREKDNTFFIPLDDGKFLKIPKPRENAVLAEPFEYGLRFALSKAGYGDWDNTESIEQMFKTGIDNIGVVNPLTDNLFSPVLSTLMNKTWYGGNIESAYEIDNLSPKDRWDESTSYIAKWLGQTPVAQSLELSPKKIDNIMDSYLGMIYDWGIGSVNEETMSNFKLRKLASPLVNQFIKDTVFSNKESTKFWDTYQELKYNSTDKSLSAKEQDEAREKYEEFESKYYYDITKLNRAINEAQYKYDVPMKNVRAMREELNKLYTSANDGSDKTVDVYEVIADNIGYNVMLNNYTSNKSKELYTSFKDSMGYKNMSKAEREESAKVYFGVFNEAKRLDNKLNDNDYEPNSGSYKEVALVSAIGLKKGTIPSGKGYVDALQKTYNIKPSTYENMATYVEYASKLKGGVDSVEKRYIVTEKTMDEGKDALRKKNQGAKVDSNYTKSMILAENKTEFSDCAYFLTECDRKINPARFLAQKKYNWSAQEISDMAIKIDADDSGRFNKQEIVDAVENSRAKTQEEKAALFDMFVAWNGKNPYGTYEAPKSKKDTGILNNEEKSSSGGGYRRRGYGGGWGHGGGGGGGKGAITDYNEWLEKLYNGTLYNADAKASSSGTAKNNTSKSALNDAYRKRVRKLMMNK